MLNDMLHYRLHIQQKVMLKAWLFLYYLLPVTCYCQEVEPKTRLDFFFYSTKIFTFITLNNTKVYHPLRKQFLPYYVQNTFRHPRSILSHSKLFIVFKLPAGQFGFRSTLVSVSLFWSNNMVLWSQTLTLQWWLYEFRHCLKHKQGWIWTAAYPSKVNSQRKPM